MDEKEEKEKSDFKDLTAKKVAEIMVANMKANMEDPDFLLKKERRLQKVTKKALEKMEESQKKRKEKL
ncbi:MAG: hypothetical protein GF311_15200 [Candidatus Lokiarchaeota archaeon]|nr:hypothetical protein [Candidatus Lokiarchaeota archaeon]